MRVRSDAADTSKLIPLNKCKLHQVHSIWVFLELQFGGLVDQQVGGGKAKFFFGDALAVDDFGTDLDFADLEVGPPVLKLFVFGLFLERYQENGSHWIL